MKPFTLIILILTIAVGVYLRGGESQEKAQVMIQDSVGSIMAAPIKTN